MAYLVLITGFPGVGKLTVARALVDLLDTRGEDVRLIDNHSVNNPIFRLVPNDGVTPLPADVWDRVTEIWDATLTTVETLTPTEWHLVFTMYLDGVTDRGAVDRLQRTADLRRATFIPLRLTCDTDENVRRITSLERVDLMKSIDPEEPHRLAAAGGPHDMEHPNQVSLDVTAVPPDEIARRILDHAIGLTAQKP